MRIVSLSVDRIVFFDLLLASRRPCIWGDAWPLVLVLNRSILLLLLCFCARSCIRLALLFLAEALAPCRREGSDGMEMDT